jgi:DNA-binding NtrC family response regulator
MPPSNTTIRHPDTVDANDQPSSWVLILLWCEAEPHRTGEVAPLPWFERIVLGRQENGTDRYALFAKQRPGEPFAPTSPAGLLAGMGISRRQLVLHATDVGIEMQNVGTCPTFVNGEARTSAILTEGHTLLLRNEALFLCAKRPRTLSGLRGIHAFGGPDGNGIVGESPLMWILRERLALLAAMPDFVLVLGESGTGKDLVGHALHRGSSRAKGPWVPHNAANTPSSLIDAELFGNAANFPNPGMKARPGLIGAADGGTLFLDEIADCPLDVQAHLLRVLQTGELRSLGDETLRRVDLRVIGATNKDKSVLREDLLARFPLEILIPPLRAHPEDIPLLARHWLLQRQRQMPEVKRFVQETRWGLQPRFRGRLIDYLVRQPLRTNFRRLHAILADAILASPGNEVTLPKELAGSDQGAPPASVSEAASEVATDSERGARERRVVEMPSREKLLECLEREGWNQSKAARALGLHRNVLRRLMVEFKLTRDKTDP